MKSGDVCVNFGPITLTNERSGETSDTRMGRIEIGEAKEGVYVWTWPLNNMPADQMSVAEELARALAVIDGRFEVRRIK